MDREPNLSALRQRIDHVVEASSHTQVTASTTKPGAGTDFRYFRVCDESIPRKTTALRAHPSYSHPRVCTIRGN